MNENRDGNSPLKKGRAVYSWPTWRQVGIFLSCCILLGETILLETLAPTDVVHYQCYALLFWTGSHAASAPACSFLPALLPSIPVLPAFHFLPIEYPPLTVLFFSLPLLVPLPYYAIAFGCFILLCTILLYLLLLRAGPPQAAPLFALYLLLGACTVLQVRFDLLPAACTLLALLAALHRRWTIGYVFLAMGVLLKLYPIIFLPAFFIAEQQMNMRSELARESFTRATLLTMFVGLCKDAVHWRWKNLGIFLAIFLLVTAFFGALNFQQGIVSPVLYFFQRPVQIETIYSSIFWLAGHFGIPYSIVFTFGSLNIKSALSGITVFGTILELLGFIFVFIQQLRRKLTLGQAMIALLCILISTGKVFSPQYMIWLIPLVACVGVSRRWLYGWSVVLVLTSAVIFYYTQMGNPGTAASVVQTLPGFFEVVALRNLLFLLLALAYLFNWRQSRGETNCWADLPLSVPRKRSMTVPTSPCDTQ